jgi:hypothetical protein
MNNVIITQLKNQGNRVYEWLKYHYKEGFDTFIIFNDISEDDSMSEIENFKVDFPSSNVSVLDTNGYGRKYSVEECQNSEIYGNDSIFHNRLNESYTKGIEIVKNINPNAICAIIDVDEFLVTETESRLVEVIENLFSDETIEQISVVNFDVKDDYDVEKKFIINNLDNFKFWSENDVDNHPIWKGRVKCIVRSGKVDRVTFVHNILHGRELRHDSEIKIRVIRDYKKLKMIHFRKPNLPKSETINFEKNEFIRLKLKKNLS